MNFLFIKRRNNLLQLHRGNKHNRIRLTETDLTVKFSFFFK
jgi:hypothetical protein